MNLERFLAWEVSHSDGGAAALLGISRDMFREWRRLEGLPARWTSHCNATLRASRYSTAEAARALRVSYQVATRELLRHGYVMVSRAGAASTVSLADPSKAFSRASRGLVAALAGGPMSAQEACCRFNATRVQLGQWARRGIVNLEYPEGGAQWVKK